jgi:prepilin-type N-terminal cleavage/methylation domain-containing protein
MRISPLPTARKAFTLLEMMLAAAVAVMLLAALYVAMDLQLRHAEAARDVVVETALVRTLFNRITADITPSLGQADPTRFTNQSGAGGSGGAGGAAGTGTTGAGGTTSGAGASGTGAAGSGGSGTTGAAASAPAVTTGNQTYLVVQGDSSTLAIYVSRVPPDPNNPNNPQAQQPFSDQRRIYYWLSGGSPGGLARQELLQVTSSDALNGTVPADSGDPNSKLLAPEVKSLQFEYFDGSEWNDSWDGTQAGSDGVTPIGPPLAIAVTLGIAGPDGEVKTYRHVVAIPTANNPTPSQLSASGTTSGSSGP